MENEEESKTVLSYILTVSRQSTTRLAPMPLRLALISTGMGQSYLHWR